jgi:geranylgeranyl pyrophosphate synthase
MAFQLIDDLLDFTSREQTLGKPVGGDLKEGKVTLPLVYALANANGAERGQVESVLGDRTYDSTSFSEIYAMVDSRGGIQRTRERAQQFTDRARQIVSEFPDSPYQRALCMLTDLVTERDR